MVIAYILTFLVTFVASIFSGMAGGGVSFVTTPFWLIIGMTSAQSGATGAFMATGMSISSMTTLHKSGHIPKDKKLLVYLLIVTVVSSVLGTIIVPKIDVDAFKLLLAVITIAAIPLLFVKPSGRMDMRKHKKVGLLLAMFFMAIGSIIISGAFSILFTLALIAFYGMSVLQTTAVKRLLFLAQSIVLLIGYAMQGYLIWQFAIVSFLGGISGAYIGTKFAVKRGEKFAKYALATMSLIGALVLLI